MRDSTVSDTLLYVLLLLGGSELDKHKETGLALKRIVRMCPKTSDDSIPEVVGLCTVLSSVHSLSCMPNESSDAVPSSSPHYHLGLLVSSRRGTHL